MLRAVEFCHTLLRDRLFPGDAAIDATAGNGHDTHLLAQLIGPDGIVFAFDVQERAIEATRRLLERWGVPAGCYELIHGSHDSAPQRIPAAWHGKLGAAVFNLGYLPGGDKSVTTRAETTVPAVRAVLDLLRPGGIVILILYPGHPGGSEEATAVRDFAAGLPLRDYHCVEYRTVNARNAPPVVLAIEKSGSEYEPEWQI